MWFDAEAIDRTLLSFIAKLGEVCVRARAWTLYQVVGNKGRVKLL